MKPLIALSFALLCGVLLSPLTRAAAPMYTIELLLFEQVGVHTGEEWPENPGVPDLGRVVDLEARPGAEVDPNTLDGHFTLRPRRELNAIADAMERSGGYRILKHLAWRQPSYGEKSTRPIRIEAGIEIPGAWLANSRPIDEASGMAMPLGRRAGLRVGQRPPFYRRTGRPARPIRWAGPIPPERAAGAWRSGRSFISRRMSNR